MDPALLIVGIDLSPHMVGPIHRVPRLETHGDAAECEGVGPLATPPLACLHELAGVIISREARCFRAVSTCVKFHRPSAKALFDGVRLVTAGAAGFGRAAVLTGRVIHPCKITLEPPEQVTSDGITRRQVTRRVKSFLLNVLDRNLGKRLGLNGLILVNEHMLRATHDAVLHVIHAALPLVLLARACFLLSALRVERLLQIRKCDATCSTPPARPCCCRRCKGVHGRCCAARRGPGELCALWITHKHIPAIFRDEVSRSAVEEDQGGDASHPKHLTQPSFEVPQSVGHSKPRHLAEIVCKLPLALIRGHKDNFKRLASALYVAVCLGELWCEAAARRAPVCAEIEAQHLGTRQSACGCCASIGSKELHVARQEAVDLVN
mmetsp:Transcript_72731/g.117977  ORF Transcript_72731/g.117977 Transcript_72731/m.117977 type:complete len:379 (+) Transcript_72731:225-1361(+)